MIVDIARFVAAERPYWDELQALLDRLDAEPESSLTLDDIERLHYVYERCSAGLVRLDAFSTGPALRAQLQALVARAYTEIHETRVPRRIHWKALWVAFPRAFRRHLPAFALSLGVTLLGVAFGWFALRMDAHSKAVLLPFEHLQQTPAERVHQEEQVKTDRLGGVKASFSAELMTHNIQVTVLTLARLCFCA